MSVPTWLGHSTAVALISLFFVVTKGRDKWTCSKGPAETEAASEPSLHLKSQPGWDIHWFREEKSSLNHCGTWQNVWALFSPREEGLNLFLREQEPPLYLELKNLDSLLHECHKIRSLYDFYSRDRALLCECGLHWEDIRMYRTKGFSRCEASLLENCYDLVNFSSNFLKAAIHWVPAFYCYLILPPFHQ